MDDYFVATVDSSVSLIALGFYRLCSCYSLLSAVILLAYLYFVFDISFSSNFDNSSLFNFLPSHQQSPDRSYIT